MCSPSIVSVNVEIKYAIRVTKTTVTTKRYANYLEERLCVEKRHGKCIIIKKFKTRNRGWTTTISAHKNLNFIQFQIDHQQNGGDLITISH